MNDPTSGSAAEGMHHVCSASARWGDPAGDPRQGDLLGSARCATRRNSTQLDKGTACLAREFPCRTGKMGDESATKPDTQATCRD